MSDQQKVYNDNIGKRLSEMTNEIDKLKADIQELKRGLMWAINDISSMRDILKQLIE